MKDFNGFETLSLGGEAITLRNLEHIIRMSNEHGRIAIIEVGKTSMVELALALLAYAKRLEASSARTPD